MKVSSSWIAAIEKADTGILMLTKAGAKYFIRDAPEQVFNKWAMSPSKGTYFYQVIEPNFTIQKV